jgi:hypothetical protein
MFYWVLVECVSTTSSFDLWMSKGGCTCDVFALVVNFLKKDYMLKYITIDLFDAFETWRQTLAKAIWFDIKKILV